MADGRLDNLTLLEASLVASGVGHRAQLQTHLQRFAEIQHRMRDLPPTNDDPVDEAAVILDWLHRHVLTGEYRPLCTRLDRALESGDYNCVTATILYRCLAVTRGRNFTTWAEPGHVFCRLDGALPVVVQTTCRRGVSAEHCSPQPSNGAAEDATARRLSDVQLVAKIYYNRGVALLQHESFAAALPLLMRACELDPDDPAARRNILACLNNWAVAECHCGRFQIALDLLAQGRTRAPNRRDFAENEVYVYLSWARRLCADGEYAEATDVLDTACRRRPSVALLHDTRASINALRINSRSSDQHRNQTLGFEATFSNVLEAASAPSSGTVGNPRRSKNTPDRDAP